MKPTCITSRHARTAAVMLALRATLPRLSAAMAQPAPPLPPPHPPNGGILFVDHSKSHRSGHLGHALVQDAPGKIVAFCPNFCPNCSCDNGGHSAVGWMDDAKHQDGEIRVRHFANDAGKDWRGTLKEHVSERHVSTDGGETFTKRSELPFVTNHRGYGAPGLLGKGESIANV